MEAGYAEIQQAYYRLKKIHSADSGILSSMTRDFSKRKRSSILRRIETAHSKLVDYFARHQRDEVPTVAETPKEKRETDTIPRPIFSGRNLRGIRLKLGISPQEAARGTKMEADLIKALEREDISALPKDKELKGILRKYARFLGLNGAVVVRDYVGGLNAKKRK